MTQFNFLPARLVKAKDRWYIIYYQTNPFTNDLERFRETHNLNKIKDKRVRLKMAKAIVLDINRKLPLGHPHADIEKVLGKTFTPVNVAIGEMLEIRKTQLGTTTFNNQKYKLRNFKQWIIDNGYDSLKIGELDKYHALEYCDYIRIKIAKKGVTYNNYIRVLRTVWTEFKKRKYVHQNIFSEISKVREEQKERRFFTPEEQDKFIFHIKKEKPYLLSVVAMIHGCFIRHTERRELKFRHIDFEKGRLYVPGRIGKNGKTQTVTIPTNVLDYFKSLGYENQPKNHYIYSKGLRPGETKVSRNSFWKSHRIELLKALELGLINDIEGLSIYSWKDTGNKFMIDNHVPLDQLQRQNRHAKATTTQVYFQHFGENPNISNLDTGIV